jgi:serine phosphatase RsbU (regulator of sigma subunit)/anti-sigma regulatory factor (Ser/Thr protein kinase)
VPSDSAATGESEPDTGHTLTEQQRVIDQALAHLSLDELLPELLERVREVLSADTAEVLLVDEDDGLLRRSAAIGLEGSGPSADEGFAERVVAERRLLAIDERPGPDVAVRSLLGVPLLVEGRAVGVLQVGALAPGHFTDDHGLLLQYTAGRAAVAIDHARLYEQERRARAAAEQAAQTVDALQRVTDAALAYLTIDELLSELLVRIRDILRADTAAILLLDDEGRMLRARAAKGIEEEVEQGVRIPLGAGFAGRVAAERRPIAIPELADAEVVNPILRQKGIRSLLGVPLLVEGRVLGVLHVGTLVPRSFDDGDVNLLQLAADRAALSIEHAALYEHRRVAETLQRSLLPVALPPLPGFETAARYLPAAMGSSVGGDWYDVFRLSAGTIGVVIGDVVGRGLPAAALMAQLRTALRAYAFDGHRPARVVDRMNRLTMQLSPSTMTTLSYLVIDPAEEELIAVSAGHLPPLVVAPDGTADYLPVEGDVALGVSRTAAYHEQRFDLPVGSTVVLFTDGAVEVRGEPLETGLERLRTLAAGARSVEQLCATIAGDDSGQQPSDDVAVLAARLNPLSEHLRTSWPAEPDALADVRHLLRRWLRRHGASEDETYDITVACQEACANAVEHAYAPGPAGFELEAEHDAGEVRLTVRDRGQWRAARGVHRGRGLPIMEALMDNVDIQQSPTGTAIRMRRALGRRAPR